MRKLLMAGVAALALLPAYPALAQNSDGDAAVGATAGGAAGGTIGFLVGGPLGAIIGGFTGAVIGAEAAVPEETIRYVGQHPVDVVRVEGTLDVGAAVPDQITIYPVEPTPQYGYFYANNRVYIVDANTRQIVYSPGYIVPQDVVTYVEANPTASVSIQGEVTAGTQLEGSLEIASVPDYPNYGYIYINDRPALVDLSSRTVVWIR